MLYAGVSSYCAAARIEFEPYVELDAPQVGIKEAKGAVRHMLHRSPLPTCIVEHDGDPERTTALLIEAFEANDYHEDDSPGRFFHNEPANVPPRRLHWDALPGARYRSTIANSRTLAGAAELTVVEPKPVLIGAQITSREGFFGYVTHALEDGLIDTSIIESI